MTSQKSDDATSSRATLWIFSGIGVFVVAAAVIAFLAGADSSGDNDDAGQANAAKVVVAETGEPTFTGAPLAPLESGPISTDPTSDPVIGAVAPSAVGADYAGSEVRIEADGQPKVVVFLAHWCPHCQAELPLIVDLVNQGKLPDGLQLVGVSTAVSPDRDNYPPSGWFDDEGWTFPVIRDSADSALFTAYGGSGLPYALYLNGENEVVARSGGSLNEALIEELWLATADS